MEINVKVTIGAEPELLTHLATLAECVQDVLKVSNAQLAAADAAKPKRTKKNAEPAKAEEKKPEPEPVKAEAPAETPKPEPEKAAAPDPEPVKAEAPAEEKADKPATISETELRAFCMDFVKKDPANKAKLAAAFRSVGADKLSTVKPEDYPKVIDYLNGAA